MVKTAQSFGPGNSMQAVLGGQIVILPGAVVEVVSAQQFLQLCGVMTFAGVIGLNSLFSFQLAPGPAGPGFLGMNFISLYGVANLLRITNPSGGKAGGVFIPPTVGIRWNGTYPPGPGACSNLVLLPASSLPAAA